MKTFYRLVILCSFISAITIFNTGALPPIHPVNQFSRSFCPEESNPSFQSGILKTDADYEKRFRSISALIDKESIRKNVYYLASAPLPRRVLNWSLPGHNLSTLEEADIWIEKQLKSYGYSPEKDATRVRAFGRDRSKPLPKQFAPPAPDAPYYTASNIFAGRQGSEHPEKVIVIIAHKDSQSWIASPGANDNAIGTSGVLELARVLSKYKPKHSIRYIFCNEEHTPWTSITAARAFKDSGQDVLALINMDGISGKSPEKAGHKTNVTRFTTPEGERLANLFTSLNQSLAIGLEQSTYRNESPGDDDGSFIKAGFPWAVANKGSIPNADPNYHSEGDTADKVDYENASVAVKLTLAVILYLDKYGRP
jgi:hypothetical protein